MAANVEYSAAALDLGLTRRLAGFIAGFSYEDLPEAARHACRRGVLDWLGCALAGSGHATIGKLVPVLRDLGGEGIVPVIGHTVRLRPLDAALANGQIGHVLDFDDTHMDGVVLHASSPVLAALLALAERAPSDGKALMTAYAAGFEAGVRAGKSAPAHHDGGWHLTGTLGTIAAAAACGKLLGLDETGITHALGIGTTQASGMQQNRGTMCKSFHAGRAASNGLLAACLAQNGFDSSAEIIEGRRGFARIYSTSSRPEALVEGLGTEWQIVANGHKPYACGVVLHPLIDAVIALAINSGLGPSAVDRIEVEVNPIALRITGVADPESGLKSKFSVRHSAAVSFTDRAAGILQYSDGRASAPEVVALRDHVYATADETLGRDEARGRLVARDGRVWTHHVRHASGTVANPMSDAAIEAKFKANAAPVIGEPAAATLAQRIWDIDRMPDVRTLLAATVKT
jgi:2-methylcitrate dehydratase PrpD